MNKSTKSTSRERRLCNKLSCAKGEVLKWPYQNWSADSFDRENLGSKNAARISRPPPDMLVVDFHPTVDVSSIEKPELYDSKQLAATCLSNLSS
jgi:hypothetical protein